MADQNRSGGVDFEADDIDIGGNVIGRDNVESHVTNNYYYGAASQQTRRAELPARRSFFGREAELDEVAKALRPTARTWGVVIDGAGGIGKTALAIEAAYLAPETDFKIKIFLSAKKQEMTAGGVRGRGDFALTDYLSVLNELAQALGQGEISRSPEKDRARLVARALNDQHALIILDNLETFDKEDRERLFVFLEELPGSCKAIVTSRRRDDVGAKSIRLNQLSEDAALKLIDELALDNDLLRRTALADRKSLHQTAGGNPLLIKWIAGQLGRTGSRCRTVAQACELLKNAPRDNDPLDFILGDLRETFSGEETAVSAALIHFSDLTPVSVIARLADVRDDTAEVTLEGLANRSLLTADAERLNYALLPVTVTYLRRFLPADVIDQTAKHLMDRVEQLVEDNGYENHDRFKVLDAEWPTIAAALPLFVQGDNARLQTACDALRNFLNFTGRWDEWLTLSLQAEDKAVTAKDWLKAGWRAYDAGYVYYLRQQSTEVLACADRATAHWRTARAGAREISIALQLRGRGNLLDQNYPAALTACREVLALRRNLSAASADVAMALNDIAGVERLSGDYAAAERDYREALRVAKQINDLEGVAGYTSNLARLALDRKDWRGAEQWAREALPLIEAIGRQELIALNCRYLAEALARLGRKAEGLPHARRAVEIYTKLRSPRLADAQDVLKECGG